MYFCIVETVILFSQDSMMNGKFKVKKKIYIYIYILEMGIFCNIIDVFTVTFDQFNASLLNKSINNFKR